eukprot:279099-Hanusia_phi.AAC.1
MISWYPNSTGTARLLKGSVKGSDRWRRVRGPDVTGPGSLRIAIRIMAGPSDGSRISDVTRPYINLI